MTIIKQIRKHDVVMTQGGSVRVERISKEAIKVLDWYNRNIAINDR